jgi:hypothetical protein
MQLRICSDSNGFNGLLSDLRYDSRIWTQADVTRYHNGDAAVDSQQKSITGAPNSIDVYDANGGLKAHSGSTVWDSSNDGVGSGLDAGLFCGTQLANFVYGSDIYGTTGSVQDANAITKSGFYSMDAAQGALLNTPYNVSARLLHINWYSATTNALQLFSQDSRIFTRSKANNVWTSWENIKNQGATLTAGVAFAVGQLGYISSDGKAYLYDANAESTAKGALVLATTAIASGASGLFLKSGEWTTSGLTAGATYYGSETSGGITTTVPTTSGAIVRIIGYAQSSTVLIFNPSNDYVVLA